MLRKYAVTWLAACEIWLKASPDTTSDETAIDGGDNDMMVYKSNDNTII